MASSVEKVRCSLGFRGQIRPQPRLVAPGSLQSIWLTTRGVARGLARGEKAQTVPTAFHEPMKVCSFRQMCTVNPPLWILFCCMLKKKTTCTDVFADVFQTGMKFFKTQDLSPNQVYQVHAGSIGFCIADFRHWMWTQEAKSPLASPGNPKIGTSGRRAVWRSLWVEDIRRVFPPGMHKTL